MYNDYWEARKYNMYQKKSEWANQTFVILANRQYSARLNTLADKLKAQDIELYHQQSKDINC